MKKIIFFNPFGPDVVSGGIKVTYQHAGILAKQGYEVLVYQPAGRPTWLDVSSRITVSDRFSPEDAALVVFPETLSEGMLDYVRIPTPATKIIFCQNQFYLYSYGLSGQTLAELGFSHFIVPGRETARSLTSMLGVGNVHIIPNSVDSGLFYPRQKRLCIATNPAKWPAEGTNSAMAQLLKTMLHLKYPHTAEVPWIALTNMSQRDVADVMGMAPIFVALSRQEAFPLTPLEAMASRCALVGLRGTGGKDYATDLNGHWFSPEQCEEIVDSIAYLIDGLSRGEPRIDRMLDEAEKTAKQYSINATYQAVVRVYGDILAQSG
ncbi:glycosyltransferase family 4 protein [Asaia astilbis]|uniref:glycosyltransferase family 4 protein n=1 Tax=Asaia astilbis TaxID=610244 RepID=UPI00047192E9|nr:glycosyltransferase family 4 protein [Asaia astilbis]